MNTPWGVSVRAGLYWYGFYAMDNYGNEFPVRSETLDLFYELQADL